MRYNVPHHHLIVVELQGLNLFQPLMHHKLLVLHLVEIRRQSPHR